MTTNRNLDLSLMVPIYPASSASSAIEAAAPSMLFGAEGVAPAGAKTAELARGLTEKVAEVLKILHEAHLAGNLHAGDLHAKQVLEAWYMQLQAESRAAPGK